MNIVEDIYWIDEPVIVKFVDDLHNPDGIKSRGGCGWTVLPMKDGSYRFTHCIVLDSDLDFVEAATVLIHEYAHLLSQADHGFLMYELWREHLREEFKRRWDNADGKEDWDADRGRTFLVGDVCCDGEE
jgi:hypothetical protein